MGSILNHLPMVVLISLGILCLGLAGVLLKVKPTYSADAVIKIEPVIPKILYGKEEARIGRKMGHLTALGSNLDEVEHAVRDARESLSS